VAVSTQGLKTPPTLDGLHLAGIDPDSVEISDPERKGNLVLADGSIREQRPVSPLGHPEVARRFAFSLDYRHLGSYQAEVEARLAFAGPHELCLWKHVTLGYRCDGSRREFFLPGRWRQALHVMSPPPGHEVARYRSEAALGWNGVPIPGEDMATAAYEAGEPEPGMIWFERGGRRFKLDAAPPGGERLILRVVPLFIVVTGQDSQARRFVEPIREPRRLVFEEV
jgi:hypothetical protein